MGGVDWEAFRGKRIFLTGGSGFIGKWLTKAFLQANRELKLEAEIDVLIRPESQVRFLYGLQEICDDWASGDLRIVYGDCSSFQLTKNYDLFIHGAIPRGDMREWTYAHYEMCVGDMAHVLGQAKQAGVKRFLFLSSGLVEGSIPPQDPRYFYALTKLSQESLCHFFSKTDMQCISARIYSVLGYGMDPHYAAAKFIHQALEEKKVTCILDQAPVRRSYLYVEDLVDKLYQLLVSENADPRLGGTQTAIGFLAREIAKYFQVPLETLHQTIEHEYYAPCFDPEEGTSITEAIAKTCALYEKHHAQSRP